MFIVVALMFTVDTYTAVESNGSITVVLEKTGDSDVSVEVLLSTMAGTAEGELLCANSKVSFYHQCLCSGNVDFEVMTSQEVVVISSASFHLVSIPIINDDIREEVEQFTVQLSLPSGSTGVVLDQDSATVEIVDEDSEYVCRCGVLSVSTYHCICVPFLSRSEH